MGLGMAGLWAVYALLALAYPGGMGYGDVKLAGALGLFLGFAGWGELVIGAFAAFVLGGLFSIGLLIARRATRRSGIPFGPWMLGGAWIGLVAGGSIASAYLTLIGVGR
jgi:leader peptidase (prepilin peptidase)/N-methyltransferase